MPLLLRWKSSTTLPVEGDRLNPEQLATLSEAAASRQPIPVGNGMAEVGDVFSVIEMTPTTDEPSLHFEGDLRSVQGLGRGMTRGSIVVHGDVGAYLGASMTGGSIEVHGNASAWAGAEMQGGRIVVRGNAGRFLGSSLPGSRLGMREGVLLVDSHGSAGDEVGRRMRRGLIAVGGKVGDLFGKGLIAGSVFAFGSVGRFAGSGMKRGTIGLFGPGEVEILSTFTATGRHAFPFLTIYLRRLIEWGFSVPPEMLSSKLERYNGDLGEGGQGEILVGPGCGR